MSNCVQVNEIRLPIFCWPRSFCVSPDGEWLAVGTGGGNIYVYSAAAPLDPRHVHLNVDDDPHNAIAVTVVEWTGLLWLQGDLGRFDGIASGFEDGHIRLVCPSTRLACVLFRS